MERPIRILVVDDEPENLKAIERTLRSSYEIVPSLDPVAALRELEKAEFSVIISDQRMPGMLGTEFLARAAKIRPLVSRVILTAYTETAEILDAINRAEIYRYVTKPWGNDDLLAAVSQAVERFKLLSENVNLISELRSVNQNLEKIVEVRTRELKEANEKLEELAMTDPLTKIWNRRAFFARLNDEIERSRRYKHRMVIAMIDVDHFKHFNDMEGHVCGDEALRKIAQGLNSNLRRTDALCRYGGEEFCAMLPETDLAHGLEICERLRSGVEESSFQGASGVAYLTISVGLAGFPDEASTAEELVNAADQALYQAKNGGRNRVVHRKSHASFFVR